MTNPSSGVFDFTSNISGTANVRAGEDTREQQENRTQMDRFASGTAAFAGPDQVVSWYQSGTTANVPTKESTAFISGYNSVSGIIISNQQRNPFQSSGNSAPTANVPNSEASITH